MVPLPSIYSYSTPGSCGRVTNPVPSSTCATLTSLDTLPRTSPPIQPPNRAAAMATDTATRITQAATAAASRGRRFRFGAIQLSAPCWVT